jgi:hypothetical protein
LVGDIAPHKGFALRRRLSQMRLRVDFEFE